MARILLNTFGSFGDIHPYLALAIGLKGRGHEAVMATAEIYRQKIEDEGVEFFPVRPDLEDLLEDEEFLRKLWHPRRGSEYLIRDYLVPHVEGSYKDLLAACEGVDVLITHLAALAGPIVADKLRIPSISVALQPLLFMSRYDPPVLAPAPWLKAFYDGRPAVFQAIARLGIRRANKWIKPLEDLRERIGVGRSRGSPLLEGYFSSYGTLALFSKYYASPQPDWPANVRQTGFLFYDQLGRGLPAIRDAALPQATQQELERFLAAGPPPVLFTLGSSAVMQPGTFYRESVEAIKKLGIRAVLLCGTLDSGELPEVVPGQIMLAPYAPFSAIMPKASVVVHQGGIGTTAQALRSGRPSLIVPWAHDQPDNAERVRKLGAGRTIPRGRYRADRAAREIEALLGDSRYQQATAMLGANIRAEDGLGAACDAVEAFLRSGEKSGVAKSKPNVSS